MVASGSIVSILTSGSLLNWWPIHVFFADTDLSFSQTLNRIFVDANLNIWIPPSRMKHLHPLLS